jgi:hypothetical protein
VLRNNIFYLREIHFLAKLHSDNCFGQEDGTNWLFHVHTFTFYTPGGFCFVFFLFITFPLSTPFFFWLHDSAAYKCGRMGKSNRRKKSANIGKVGKRGAS